jgi:hypothetical protein
MNQSASAKAQRDRRRLNLAAKATPNHRANPVIERHSEVAPHYAMASDCREAYAH